MSLKSILPIAATLLFFSGWVSIARADDAAEAREHFKRGSKAFDLGHYADAIKEYEAAYNIKDDPALLFNIAQAYRLDGDYQNAIRVYKSFLHRMPNAPNRAEVDRRITELEKVVERQTQAKKGPPEGTLPPSAAPAPTPTPTPPTASNVAPTTAEPAATAAETSAAVEPPAHAGRTKKIAGLALLGVAAGALVGGIVTAVLSGQASDSINAAAKAGNPFDPSKESAGKTDTIVSGVMFGVAGAAAVAGGVLLVLGIREGHAHERKVSLLPTLSPTSVGASATVRF